jgi:magnesium-transporting ATPase (P-type)
MQDAQPRFVPLAVKTVVCHSITYMIMGALAYHFLHYADVINNPNSGMRPVTSLWVILGVPLQVFRGVLFASVFYLFRERLFGRKNGWLAMAWMLIGIGILGTFAAPAGSLEGFIYTTAPVASQLRGYLEIVTQALLLSALLCYWVNHSGKKWLSWTLGIAYLICVGLPLLALVAPKR